MKKRRVLFVSTYTGARSLIAERFTKQLAAGGISAYSSRGLMEIRFNSDETKRIREGINEKYKRVALSPEGNFNYPTGRAGLEGQEYDPEVLKALPENVLASYCGVGNPFSLGPVNQGEAVLDIGCGAGVDALVAAILVGPEGKVIGLDLAPEMLKRARTNLEKTSVENVTFQEGSAEQLPFPDETFDIVISNGVFNLIPDKAKALRETFRVLKPSGHFLLADQILMDAIPADTESMITNWSR
jgi:arsenite methyltransferase